jgi:hypothetical protein
MLSGTNVVFGHLGRMSEEKHPVQVGINVIPHLFKFRIPKQFRLLAC